MGKKASTALQEVIFISVGLFLYVKAAFMISKSLPFIQINLEMNEDNHQFQYSAPGSSYFLSSMTKPGMIFLKISHVSL